MIGILIPRSNRDLHLINIDSITFLLIIGLKLIKKSVFQKTVQGLQCLQYPHK